MEEKFWKNSRCSSHLKSIELSKFEFRALGGPESRGYITTKVSKPRFSSKIPRSWRKV